MAELVTSVNSDSFYLPNDPHVLVYNLEMSLYTRGCALYIMGLGLVCRSTPGINMGTKNPTRLVAILDLYNNPPSRDWGQYWTCTTTHLVGTGDNTGLVHKPPKGTGD